MIFEGSVSRITVSVSNSVRYGIAGHRRDALAVNLTNQGYCAHRLAGDAKRAIVSSEGALG